MDARLLRTPLYDWHHCHGGRMVDFAGWAMPVQYTSILQEHAAIRSGVGMAELPFNIAVEIEAEVEIEG